MDASGLRVVADDLTGACDIAAALLPWPGDVFVEAYAAGMPSPPGLVVRNTQSRMLAVDAARAAVARAVGPADPPPILLKKIDTALRGHLGVELESVMDVLGARDAFVAPAIPAVGRTTVGGVQHIDGTPVHQTAFAADPLHPIVTSAVGDHLARGTQLRARVLTLADVRSPARLAAASANAGGHGRSAFVCDAETDDDLDRIVRFATRRSRPCVLAGSLGVGRALRRWVDVPGADAARPPGARGAGGILVVVGSMHPAARAQAAALGVPRMEIALDTDAEHVGARIGHSLARGRDVLVESPAAIDAGAAEGLLRSIARAVALGARGGRPAGFVIAGGETAHAVLRELGQPHLRVVEALEALIVGSELVGGDLDGVPVVTKGGSSGDAQALRRGVAWVRGGGR